MHNDFETLLRLLYPNYHTATFGDRKKSLEAVGAWKHLRCRTDLEAFVEIQNKRIQQKCLAFSKS